MIDPKTIQALMTGIAPVIKDFVGAAIAPLQQRIAELETRDVKYLGIWREGREYSAGSVCTHDGSAWHAEKSTVARPGEGSADWVLMVKRGRDGKDAR